MTRRNVSSEQESFGVTEDGDFARKPHDTIGNDIIELRERQAMMDRALYWTVHMIQRHDHKWTIFRNYLIMALPILTAFGLEHIMPALPASVSSKKYAELAKGAVWALLMSAGFMGLPMFMYSLMQGMLEERRQKQAARERNANQNMTEVKKPEGNEGEEGDMAAADQDYTERDDQEREGPEPHTIGGEDTSER